jgi:hypothetical protein
MSRIAPTAVGSRTERAPSADLLGCVSVCVAAGLNLESEEKKGGGKRSRKKNASCHSVSFCKAIICT